MAVAQDSAAHALCFLIMNLSGHAACRCGTHIRIIEAIQAAGKEMKGGK